VLNYDNGGERISADGWQEHADHVARYEYAGRQVRPGEQVNDIACGVGYGAEFFRHADYRGYDRPGVPAAGKFPGVFYGADLDDPGWEPPPADFTVCFETIEHVRDPAALAAVISRTTRRAVAVSVPTYPHEENPFHLTTFTTADVPPLFPGFRVADEWPQPEGRSHIWLLSRDPA
jgi:hypothetical protein